MRELAEAHRAGHPRAALERVQRAAQLPRGAGIAGATPPAYLLRRPAGRARPPPRGRSATPARRRRRGWRRARRAAIPSANRLPPTGDGAAAGAGAVRSRIRRRFGRRSRDGGHRGRAFLGCRFAARRTTDRVDGFLGRDKLVGGLRLGIDRHRLGRRLALQRVQRSLDLVGFRRIRRVEPGARLHAGDELAEPPYRIAEHAAATIRAAAESFVAARAGIARASPPSTR